MVTAKCRHMKRCTPQVRQLADTQYSFVFKGTIDFALFPPPRPLLQCSTLSLHASSYYGGSSSCRDGEDVSLSFHRAHQRSQSLATSSISQLSIHGLSTSAQYLLETRWAENTSCAG